MTSEGPQIVRLATATIRHQLQVPIVYGNWVMRHREFVLVGAELESGHWGFSYGLTREGPVDRIVEHSIAPHYVGATVTDPAAVFDQALWSNHAVHAAGIGYRALSLTDVAAWDALARFRGVPIGELLGAGRTLDLPATAIVGYPPSTSPEATAAMVSDLLALGWRRFKLPIAPDIELSIRRLAAAREAAPAAWIGFDANMVFRTAAETLDFEGRVRHLELGWIEDLIPPGDARTVAEVRSAGLTPVAMGDEQGGAYHPQALLSHHAVDVLRVDATTNGGVTGLRRVLQQAGAARVDVAPHMFPHFHARILGALQVEAPIEWGVAGTGVHPMDDGLERPTLVGGRMRPLSETTGFGRVVDRAWVEAQADVRDPDGLLQADQEDAFR